MTRCPGRYAVPLLIALCVLPLPVHAAGCKDATPTSWDIVVAPKSERGERLFVRGRVLSRADRSPLAGITVYAYHADSTGNYQLPGHENEPPRLCGILRTNEKGEYRLETSMPGSYDGLPHIHFEIWGPHVSRQYTFVGLKRESLTMDTAHAVPRPDPPALRDVRMGLTRPVYRGAGGVLQCTRDLEVVVK